MTRRLTIVGRDYGFHEHMAKKPFVGPAGSLLNRALKAADIRRDDCLVTNVVNKKPPHDEWHLHSAHDIKEGVAALHALCRREEPPLIVALGEHALHALIAGDPDAARYKITEARGYVFPSEFGPVLACTHPAFVLRNWHPWWALLNWDLRKARRVYSEALHGGWKGGESTSRLRREYVWTDAGKEPWPALALNGTAPLAVDIETGAEQEILCIGWAATPETGYCAPFRDAFIPWFRRLLASSMPKVFQNGQFDVTILERHGFEVRNWQHDTMLQWHSVEPLLAGKVLFGEDGNGGAKMTHKSLRFLASILTDEPFWKDYAFETEMDRYVLCARDARITLEIFEKLNQRLQEAP